jgi:hypothetical protein
LPVAAITGNPPDEKELAHKDHDSPRPQTPDPAAHRRHRVRSGRAGACAGLWPRRAAGERLTSLLQEHIVVAADLPISSGWSEGARRSARPCAFTVLSAAAAASE